LKRVRKFSELAEDTRLSNLEREDNAQLGRLSGESVLKALQESGRRSLLGVFIDFHGLPRDKIADAWDGAIAAQASPTEYAVLEKAGSLFSGEAKPGES